MDKIRRLVGDITPEQLACVDCAVTGVMGIFMPVAGQCKYAIQPEHTHPGWSFIVSFDSYCRVRLGEKTVDSVPSQIFVLPPDVPHQELPSERIPRYIAVMIEPVFFSTQLAVYRRSTMDLFCGMTGSFSPRLVDALKEFLGEYEAAVPGYRHLLDACVLRITHLLIRQLLGIVRPGDKISCRISVNRAIDFLNSHLGGKISVNDLACAASLSPSHFSRVFREETGLTPVEYIMQTRLDCAKRMLRGNEKNLSEIALECGFNSSSYFYQCFTRAFGMAPSDYRKNLQIAKN